MADYLNDLLGSGASPVPCNPMRWRYPFRNNPITPDIYSRVIERDYRIAASAYNYVPAPFTTNNFTNLGLWSSTLTNAYWDIQNGLSGVLDGIARNPWDGTYTLGFVGENGATSSHYFARSAVAIGSGGFYCLSLFVLSTGSAPFQLFFGNGVTDYVYANFSPALGTNTKSATTFGAASNADSGVQDLGIIPFGHYYRMWVRGRINNGVTSVQYGMCFINDSQDGRVPSFTGTSRSLYAGGFQFESGSAGIPLTPSVYLATTTTARTATLVPSSHAQLIPTDPVVDPFAFCVMEGDPVAGDALLAGFTRWFARIPLAQIIPSTKYFTRPVMDDVFIASTAWAVSFDDAKQFSHVFTSRKTTGISIGALTLGTTPAGQTFDTLPGTTITFTDSAGTGLGIAVNAGATAIRAALVAAYPATMTNFIVGATNNSVVISWTNGTGYMKTIDLPSSVVRMDWTPGSTSAAFNSADTRTAAPNQNPSLRTINCTGHGGVVGDLVVFWNGNKIVAKSIVMAVASADAFSVNAADVDGKDIVINAIGMSSDAAACYVNGAKVCTARKTTTFYLPGYSVGITTYADIPTQLTYIDALSWLGRIIAVPTGWANIEVSEVTQWMGAILQQEITEIQMDDALDTVTP